MKKFSKRESDLRFQINTNRNCDFKSTRIGAANLYQKSKACTLSRFHLNC